MSIKKSLQSSIILMAIIPVILMAILSYVVAATKYAQINTETTKQLAEDYSYSFSSQLETQRIETSSIANLNDTKSYLLEKINSPDVLLNTSSTYYTNIKNTITQLAINYDNNVNYYIYDIDGYLVVSSANDSISDWSEIMIEPITSISQEQIISHSDFSKNSIDIVCPIIVKNQTIGLIRTNITSDYFGNYLSSDDDSTCFVIDKNGEALFGYSTNSEADQSFLDEIIRTSSSKLVISTSEVDVDTSYKEQNNVFSSGKNYNYGYATIPEHHWIYVVKQNSNTFTSIVSSLPIILLILLVIVVILSIQISQGLAAKYTQPIIELNEDMKTAASGELNVHCSINSDDEFGTLSNSFNQMMDIISTNYNDAMDSKKELEASKQELQLHYEDMERLAYTDTLTGLYNRAAFFRYANEILTNSRFGLKSHAVIFIDLDGFKSINDTLGHDYGDLLLKAVTEKFSSFIDKDDILARNGGDEFVILRNHIQSTEELEAFLQRLISISSHPFLLELLSSRKMVYP